MTPLANATSRHCSPLKEEIYKLFSIRPRVAVLVRGLLLAQQSENAYMIISQIIVL